MVFDETGAIDDLTVALVARHYRTRDLVLSRHGCYGLVRFDISIGSRMMSGMQRLTKESVL